MGIEINTELVVLCIKRAQQQYANRPLWYLSNELIVLNGPWGWQEYILHTVTSPPPAWTVDTRRVESVDSRCQHQSQTAIWVPQQKFRFINFINKWACDHEFFFVLGWPNWNLKWFSAGFDVSGSPFLFTANVQSGYLSFCLPFLPAQINGTILSSVIISVCGSAAHWVCFSSLHLSEQTAETDLCVKIPRDQQQVWKWPNQSKKKKKKISTALLSHKVPSEYSECMQIKHSL